MDLKKKLGAIELETVIIFIIILIVFAVMIVLFITYGGSGVSSLKNTVTNVISISNETTKALMTK